MTQEELNKVLELHKKWLDGDSTGRIADLRGADLRGAGLRDADFRNATLRGADLNGADLRGADLYGANLSCADLHGAVLHRASLRDANLSGVNLDCSSLQLWCGGLDVHIDDRIAIQLLYHLVRNVLFSQNTSEEIKRLLSQKEIVKVANQFHRVDECGRIEVTEQCQ